MVLSHDSYLATKMQERQIIAEPMRPQVEEIVLSVLEQLRPLREKTLIQGFLGAVEKVDKS
ncbi:MAG: hypothetical protein ACREBU_02205 [Nitrososphaera sp.]